jgi:hypothetical protein
MCTFALGATISALICGCVVVVVVRIHGIVHAICRHELQHGWVLTWMVEVDMGGNLCG